MKPHRIAFSLLACVLFSGMLFARQTSSGMELFLEPPISGVASMAVAVGAPRRLVVARPDGLEILSGFTRDGSAPGELLAEFPRGERRLFAWCVAGDATGRQQLFVLTDGGAVDILRGDEKDGGKPRRVLLKSGVNLPDGLYHLPFVRDLNDDGFLDLVVPRIDGLELYFGSDSGFLPGPAVHHRVVLDVDLDGPLEGSPAVRQEIRIPRFEVEDQNGDGHPDLVFRDSDHVQFFWTTPDGRLPDEPTFTLDLEQIRSRLPARSGDLVDTSNLLKVLETQVSHLSSDFNADGYFDLLLRRGRKVSIYRGGPGGVDRSRATQVLKTSGNLLTAFALDDDGDGQDDLCMLRVADVSLGQVLLWLVAGGDLTLDLFVYAQLEDLRFSRKPTRRRTLQVAIPSVSRMITGFEERVENLGLEFKRIPVRGDLDGDGEQDDLVRMVGDDRVELFLDADSADRDAMASAWFDVLRQFDAEASDSGRLDAELIELVDWIPLPGRDLVRLLKSRTPDGILELANQGEDAEVDRSLFVLDLDGDGQDDVLLSEQKSEGDPLRLVLLRGLLVR